MINVSKVELQRQVLEQPVEVFAEYTVELNFPDDHRQHVNIQYVADVENLLKTIAENVNSNHIAIEMHFDRNTSDREVNMRIENFQKFSATQVLQINISIYESCRIVIQPKPIKSENIGDGKIRHSYTNGVIEEFTLNYKGRRIFPDCKKEEGEFHIRSGKLISGYQIEINGKIEFISPKSFGYYKEELEKNEFDICDIEGKLVVIKKTYDKDHRHRIKYEITGISVEEILLKSSQRRSYGNGRSIKDVLLHKNFNENLRSFIEHILVADKSGVPKLFGLSNFAVLDVIEIGSKIIDLNPLKIIDPISGRNFIAQAANWGSAKLLNKLIELFPQEFLSIGQTVIAELLTQGHPKLLVYDVATQFIKLGGAPDTYHSLWIQVARSAKPNEMFKEQFYSLSTDQQRTLYDSAFVYNNPFICEPSDHPITADQYSINLMWINKNRMPADQEFLFGNGSSSEERELDFHNRFIKPVSKWAITNPGSYINIWVDSEMATTQAIEQSRIALENSLKGTSCGVIQFRDVRSIDVVCANPKAFCEEIPIYFRVDLLRAIAADYTLRKRETKFFVYGDIDMKPLSAKEIFDKRTVNFLNDFGFVMAKGGYLGFDNEFQILNGDNQQFMNSHRKVIIDLSVEMTLKMPKAIQEQQIYDTYPAMITHFLDADGRYGKFHSDKYDMDLNKLSISDKLSIFRYDRFETCAHRNLPLGEKKIELKNVMPMKNVRLPPSHF